MSKYLSIISLIFVFYSCRKEETLGSYFIQIQDVCDEFTDSELDNSIQSKELFGTPCFNPNNNSQFVYSYWDLETTTFQLRLHNLSTCEDKLLVDNVSVISQPKWSKSGIITFDNSLNYKVSVVNENSGSLYEIDYPTANLYPSINTYGTRLFWCHSPTLGVPYFYLSANLNGSDIDTLLTSEGQNLGFSGYSDLNDSNWIVCKTFINNEEHLAVKNLNVPESDFISLLNLTQMDMRGIDGICWSGNSEHVFFTIPSSIIAENRGLFKINVSNSKITRLIKFCPSKRMKSVSCSSDDKNLLVEMILYERENNQNTNLIVCKSHICRIELSSLKQTIINI